MGDRTFASTKMEVTVFNVQSLREFVSAYRTLSRTFKKSSEDTEKKVWTLKLKDDEKISIEKTVTAGGMLKLVMKMMRMSRKQWKDLKICLPLTSGIR